VLNEAEGRIRYQHPGEGRYEQSERAIQSLLDVPDRLPEEVVDIEGEGVEAAADWATLRTPETSLGFERAERFASPGRAACAERHTYTTPSRLKLTSGRYRGTGRPGERPRDSA
jgi:hypothetical protein